MHMTYSPTAQRRWRTRMVAQERDWQGRNGQVSYSVVCVCDTSTNCRKCAEEGHKEAEDLLTGTERALCNRVTQALVSGLPVSELDASAFRSLRKVVPF
jgi:hypothetical protein